MEFVLDAYAARSCPVKTHNAFHPGVSLPAGDESLRERFHGGIAFSQEVLAELVAGDPGRVVDCRGLTDLRSVEQEQACLAALREGADAVIGGLLPRDWPGHRSGRPDLLLRDGRGYVPVVVKSHRVIDRRGDGCVLTFSRLGSPGFRQRAEGFRYRWNWRINNVLQLAHYWRMLQRLGLAADEPWAGVVGTDDLIEGERVITWIRLDEPSVTPNPRMMADPDDPQLVSSLARYDHEFGFREQLAIAAAAQAPDDPPVLAPIVNRECGYCQWWDVCRPLLHDDDLSLRISKSPLDVHEIRVLRELGIETVTALAETELEELLPRYLPRVTHRVGGEDRLRLAWRRSVLMARGIDFDRVTTGPIDLPSAPLEIDIDVETSVGDRVYLWGFLVHDPQPRYVEFSAFAELDDAGEWELARRAMRWLREQVAGREALVFHYSDYEVLRLERLAAASGDPTLAWAVDYAHRRFVDLFVPIRQHFFGTQGLGLKVVASKAAGFAWRDESPGGLNSQAWFAEAVAGADDEARARARRRVLEYNEDDVRATWHVRRWLRGLR